jgi:nitroreductase
MSKYIEKDADNIHEIIPQIKKRFSPRAFENKPVEKEKLFRIFEAARWSPSARNVQPWRFLVGIKGENKVYDRIFDSLVEWNQNWNNNTPVLVAIIAKTTDDKERNHATHDYDTGIAVAQMTFQLTELGLHAHQMGGFEEVILREYFKISNEYKPIAIMAIGYKGSLDDLPEDYHEAELEQRTRRDFEEIVFWEGWLEK